MPGWMELDLVDPVAEAVVRVQPRRALVREAAPFLRLAGQELAEPARLLVRPVCPLARECLDEGTVLEEEVVARERRRLVEDVRLGLHRPTDYRSRGTEGVRPGTRVW